MYCKCLAISASFNGVTTVRLPMTARAAVTAVTARSRKVMKMSDRFTYKVIRKAPEPPPIQCVIVDLQVGDVRTIHHALKEMFPDLLDDETSVTGMFAKITREIGLLP